MVGDDSEINATGGTIKRSGEELIADAIPTKDGAEAAVTATAASTTDKQASAAGESTPGVSLTRAEGVERPSFGASAAPNDTASAGEGADIIKATDAQNNEDAVIAAGEAAKGGVDDEKACNGPDQGDDVYDIGEDDDDLSSSVEGGKDSSGWADVEDGERTGYSGAEVEPFAVQEGIDGSCVLEVCGASL